MSSKVINDNTLSAIADSIREKLNVDTAYKPSEMPAAIESIESYPEPTGSVLITENGSANVKDYATAIVNVPNSYEAEDEGKVVSDGALVAQTSQTFTQNGTYDTTTNDEVVVNVSGGGSTLVTKIITENGTYDPADDNADGYSEVTVNVSGGDDPFAGLTDYIESSGTQYINTGYLTQANSRFELIANVNSNNASYATAFGARGSGSSFAAQKEIFIYVNANNSNQFIINWGLSSAPSYSLASKYYNFKTLYVLSISNYRFQNVDGVKVDGGVYSGVEATSEYPIFLFSLNSAGSDFGADTHCTMKVYRFRIYEGDTLVHEFIPWVDDSNIVCLKDTVTNTLFYNAGTGDFTYGTDA